MEMLFWHDFSIQYEAGYDCTAALEIDLDTSKHSPSSNYCYYAYALLCQFFFSFFK